VSMRLRRNVARALGALLVLVGASARASAQSGEWYYGATGAAHGRFLLSKIPGWQRPSCKDCSDGATPQVAVDKPSLRDMYVLEAVMRAWTAESFALAGDRESARWQGELVRFDLENASALCNKPRDLGAGDGGSINRLWPCPAPTVPFDTTLETIPLIERIRRLREAEERLAAQRAAGVSQRAAIEKSVHEKLELATLSSKKGLFLDAAELIADAVSELAIGWTQASPSALLPDLIRDAREGLLTLKTACAAEQQFAKSRNAPAVKCP
jgi:hypothetical protein